MKNIRGFLFKRRKSPLKGWHKVRHHNIMYIIPLSLTLSLPSSLSLTLSLPLPFFLSLILSLSVSLSSSLSLSLSPPLPLPPPTHLATTCIYMYTCIQRYFTLQAGILTCARNPAQLSKGKLLSRTDLGLAVITCDSSRWRIDIDEERQVYHLKVTVN